MENIKIQFKGITRNTDDGMCQDGESMELMNARVNNASIEPIPRPVLKKTTANTYKEIYHHVNAKRYIGLTADGNLYSMEEDLTNEGLIASGQNITGVEFIGNTIAALTPNGIMYYLFREGGYKTLGKIPEIPNIEIKKELATASAEDDNVTMGGYFAAIDEAGKKGGYVHAAAFRCAYRLYDGSYTKHSSIMYILLTQQDKLKVNAIAGEAELAGTDKFYSQFTNKEWCQTQDREGKKYFTLLYFNAVFKMTPLLLKDWSDIIVSLDIFSTSSLRHPYVFPIGDTEEYPTVNEQVKNISIFNLVGSIPAGNIPDTYTIDADVRKDILATQPAISDDPLSHNTHIYKKGYSYNNRLHVWGRMEKLFPWYNGCFINDNYDSIQTNLAYLYVYIRADKDIILKKEIKVRDYFGPYVMYPDTRAYKIEIYVPTPKKKITLPLTTHNSLNVAYYYKPWEITVGERDNNPLISVDAGENYTDLPKETDNTSSQDENVLRVSEVNSPFSFPLAQTYQFPTPIIGVQANVIALSQGQFGQFPLYVFTQDGVYAMSTDTSGKIAYLNQTPITRDVCTNAESLCPLDTAVAFATEKGLMIIDGAQTRLISEALDGYLPSCYNSSPILPKIAKVASLENSVSTIYFPEYLKGAKVGYNYQEQEIIVANPSYEYSYVYSLRTGQWHKISEKIDNFINSYPYTWILRGSSIYDMNVIERSVATIMLMTRPIKMGILTYKRILQTALRGIVKQSSSVLYLRGEPLLLRGQELGLFSNCGMYMLGSNDAEHFNLVAKKEMMEDIRDLVTKMNKSKAYKYYMLCLVGGVRTDVSLNYVEMLVDESYTNRLR